ncbi:hypothetical protein ABVK25_001673 [Lepraria finkii]|uniref:Uncharacterized protein n=1 Tax=Lepraria finkii TaxID=1340010 RepID=A0ABR4BJQ4_9LECA
MGSRLPPLVPNKPSYQLLYSITKQPPSTLPHYLSIHYGALGPILFVGSGPMIGSYIACLFAKHTFTKVALFSRQSLAGHPLLSPPPPHPPPYISTPPTRPTTLPLSIALKKPCPNRAVRHRRHHRGLAIYNHEHAAASATGIGQVPSGLASRAVCDFINSHSPAFYARVLFIHC